MPCLYFVGLWTASEFDTSSRVRLWTSNTLGRLAECHYFSFLHFWILASFKDFNWVCEHRHGLCHVCHDAASSLGVLPLRSPISARQPLPQRSPVCLGVSGLEVTGGAPHFRHAQLRPARIRSVAMSAAEVEREHAKPVHWVVRGSVCRRGRWSGVPVTRGSCAASAGLRDCYAVLSPATCQAAEAQRQHPWTLGWSWNSRGPPSHPPVMIK